MNTQIHVFVRRGEYSSLANSYRGCKFKCKDVTFADYAPSMNPRRDGWLEFDESIPLTDLRAEEIWYRLSTVGGRHRVYYKPVERNKPIYCLLSTLNSQMEGWECYATSFSKDELWQKANELWGGVDEYGNRSIYDDTYWKNAKVVSRSKAVRVFHAYVVYEGSIFPL